MNKHHLTIIGLLALSAGCESSQTEVGSGREGLVVSSLDVISPANCRLKNNKLIQCSIPATTVDAVAEESAVPLRTVLTRTKTGTCSTPYELSIGATLDDGTAGSLRYLPNDRLELRKAGGVATTSVALRDGSTWTGLAAFDSTCRVVLSITANELDIDSREEAHALLAQIEGELAAAALEERRNQELLTFHAAYDFMHSLVQVFHTELTNETMQALRRTALAARPALLVAVDSCSTLSGDEADQLFDLWELLIVLGDQATWQNPDGSTRSIADIMGPDAAAVYQSVLTLEAQASPNLQDQYQTALLAATEVRVRLEAKLTQARLQLAPWLEQETTP
jgi:hypothetical protein